MATRQAKEHLLRFLDQHAFQPVLQARVEDYPEAERYKLQHVKQATVRERERYQRYDSAEKVFRMYRDDLHSEEAQKVDRELRDLNLPTLADCRDEFEGEADRLDVH